MENADDKTTSQWVEDRLSAVGQDREWEPDVSLGLLRLDQKRGARVARRRAIVSASAAVAVMAILLGLVVGRRAATPVESTRSFTASERAAGRRLARDISMFDASGRAVKLSDFRGQVVALNFWATWCEPCKVEIPLMKQFQEGYRDQGFTVLGVSVDEKGWNAVKPFAAAMSINYPIFIGGQEDSGRYGDSVPTTVIIDRAGRVAAVHIGLCNRNEYESDILAVLREK
jgi:thiol-disulfide isomerase/thioredoxin